MSGSKHARPNYEQQYQQELHRRQELESQNRDLERKNREQEVVRKQIAESEKRVRHDIEAMKISAQRTAEELVHLHENQRRAIEDIAGVRVQLNVTNENIQNLRWESQQQQQSLTEGQVRIQEMVQQNRAEIQQNRESILQNKKAIDEGFQRVDDQLGTIQKTVEFIETKEQLEKMRTAAQLIETALITQYNVSTETLQRFAPDRYAQAQDLLQRSQELFARGDYAASIGVAQPAMVTMSDAAAEAQEKDRQYKVLRDQTYETYNRLQAVLEGMRLQDDSESQINDVRLWRPDEYNNLVDNFNQIERLIQQEQYEDVHKKCTKLYEDAIGLRGEVDLLLDQHTAREMLVETLVEALTAYGPVTPGNIEFADINDPTSDVIIYTDRPEIHLPLSSQPEFRYENPKDPDQNRRDIEQTEKVLQQRNVARRLNY